MSPHAGEPRPGREPAGDPLRAEAERRWGGLCPGCRHARLLRSDRDSLFLRCALSGSEPGFRKYPPQPVVSCPGRVG